MHQHVILPGEVVNDIKAKVESMLKQIIALKKDIFFSAVDKQTMKVIQKT